MEHKRLPYQCQGVLLSNIFQGMAGLAEYLRAKREELNLTQKGLAQAAGATQAAISDIERGQTKLPNADIRRRLAKALGVSHLDLLVAAGEITREELGTVAGVVERDPDDPRVEFHQLLDQVRLDRQRVAFLRDVLGGMARYDQEGER